MKKVIVVLGLFASVLVIGCEDKSFENEETRIDETKLQLIDKDDIQEPDERD